MKKNALYEETIPVLVKFLGNLGDIIDHGKKFVRQGRVSEKKLIAGRLAPDMYTLTQQVGYAYFMALETACNLSGKAMPSGFTYDEKSLTELQASVKRVITFLKSVKPSTYTALEGKKVKTFLHPTEQFSRETYVRMLALPNFFFHVTTAYDIFRHFGVPLKKDIYLGLVKKK